MKPMLPMMETGLSAISLYWPLYRMWILEFGLSSLLFLPQIPLSYARSHYALVTTSFSSS